MVETGTSDPCRPAPASAIIGDTRPTARHAAVERRRVASRHLEPCMPDFSITVDIDASPERVWSVMQDVERWHEWSDFITSIRSLDRGPLRVGSRALIRQPKLLPAEWRVTAVEEDRGFTWVTTTPGLRVEAHHRIVPIGSGARVTLLLEFTGPVGWVVAHLTRGLNARYLAMEAHGLKRRSESPPV
jgi:uncharacterized membrane protein